MFRKWRYNKRCKQLAEHCKESVMCDYIRGCVKLDPGRLADTDLIAVDLEQTGLDVSSN